MKILHTSDWHLGKSLDNQKRYDEFDRFLEWLIEFIAHEKIDILLVAGDIFDTTTPSNRAQELYYRFLGKVARTCCGHVVIIGGNHDSPTLLDAPKSILKAIDVHVMGSVTDNPEDEVIELKSKSGETQAIVCAVPYLRDRDVRTVSPGEDPGDKTKKLLEGIASHYEHIAQISRRLKSDRTSVPVIGMGHLFTRNARTIEGDGVRELYIGTLAHIEEKKISEGFDYMALGHLHMAQKAENSDIVRYSGSPLPMSFSEAGQTKKVIVAEFKGDVPVITEHPVPCFQELKRLSGDIGTLTSRIEELINEGSRAWLEIEITAFTAEANLTDYFDSLLKGSSLEILRIKNSAVAERVLSRVNETETLETIDPYVVFTRCLDAGNVPEEDRGILIETYHEAMNAIQNADTNAN
ncbi:MAG TPA: exonuclease SbcCD subunit D C-terminal domain-containing protein [Bacteroidales bacterium]|nr:exonuclease SbcCD subunit D C-terminal domain-containing protein [Bacteroidales bacterium]